MVQGVEIIAKTRVGAQQFGEELHVVAGALDVPAGAGVARLGERGHALDDDVLREGELAGERGRLALALAKAQEGEQREGPGEHGLGEQRGDEQALP